MKNRIKAIIGVSIISLNLLTGCQATTKNLGGTTTINLEPNTKLELITWKDDDLWYLTRPMREDDIAETHVYQQKSELGILEGTVKIIESKSMSVGERYDVAQR